MTTDKLLCAACKWVVFTSSVLFVLDTKRTKKVKAEKCFRPRAYPPPRFSAGPALWESHNQDFRAL